MGIYKMSEEIELKFYIDSTDNVELISDTVENALKDYQIECKGTQKLANAYYDTKDLILKNLNMGVRVRSVDDKFHEQTAKCSGIVIGGLHKRVEYNVPVETPVPDLKKFPTVMWKDQDVELLQHNIEKKFETNFKRKLWHIKQNDQLIAEICFDQGVVETKDQKEAINEIEIEVKKGNVDNIIDIAKKIIDYDQIKMHLDSRSKAYRGYELAGLSSLPKAKSFIIDESGDREKALHSYLSQFTEHEQIMLSNYDVRALSVMTLSAYELKKLTGDTYYGKISEILSELEKTASMNEEKKKIFLDLISSREYLNFLLEIYRILFK